jgi:N-acetylglucosamine-6-phosphate deacetylase
VGAALDFPETFVGIIADLHHVAPPVLRATIRAKSVDRTMLVTDAMPTVGTGLTSFVLQGREIFRREGRLTMADGTLAGSDLDMASAVQNAVEHLGADLPAALGMASAVPAVFLRMDGELGRIAAGYRASLALLDDDQNVLRTWIDGRESAPQSER